MEYHPLEFLQNHLISQQQIVVDNGFKNQCLQDIYLLSLTNIILLK